MSKGFNMPARQILSALAVAGAILGISPAAAVDYHAIAADAGEQVITLTGHDLSIEDVVAVARHGAQVQYSPEAIQRAADGNALRAEAGAENIPVYGLNRGAGALREVRVKRDEIAQLSVARAGAKEGVLPEITDEDLVRAFLVIRANSVPFEAAEREFMQLLVNLLNKRVTPVMSSRGTLGEGDLFLTSNFLATMVGRGDAYYQGVRMTAAEALEKAGLKPLSTKFGGGTSNSYADAIAALLVADGKQVLEWADLIHAMDKLGMKFQRHADGVAGPGKAAVQMGRVGRVPDHGHAEGELSFRGRSQAHSARPREHARLLYPPGLGVAGLGGAARQRPGADKFRRAESGGAARCVAERFLGAVDTAVHEVLREGWTAQPWPARLCYLDRQLGSLSHGQRDRSLHQCDCEYGRRNCAAD